MAAPERAQVLSLLRALANTVLRDAALAGSSGLYGASEALPALTEDTDVIVDADWLAAHEAEVVEDLARLGFSHEPGTPTFTRADGLSLDLVGFSRADPRDRVGGGARVPVMVFSDLSTILDAAHATVALPGGGRALSPAALAVSKLLTVRLEKGAKDKLQALLLADERRGDAQFWAEVMDLLARFSDDRVADALADARAALLVLSADRERADPALSGYGPFLEAARRGLDALAAALGRKARP
jgi:hypothetical protein